MSQLDFPTILLLPTHMEPDEVAELEIRIPSLTYDVAEAEIILGKITKKDRAKLELRKRKVFTTDISVANDASPGNKSTQSSEPCVVAREDGSSTASGSDEVSIVLNGNNEPSDGSQRHPGNHSRSTIEPSQEQRQTPSQDYQITKDIVRVVRLAWFTDSVSKGKVLPLDSYMIYQGRKEATPEPISLPKHLKPPDAPKRERDDIDDSLTSNQGKRQRISETARPMLLKETTSEHDMNENLPPVPDYLKTMYSCQRPTPFKSPNAAFVEELKKMRSIRALDNDKVGVRAYSTAIAVISAYPHFLTRAKEIERLKGCGPKFADLFTQWQSKGQLREVAGSNKDPRFSVLRQFYDIWGVAETTAREFYNKGWRDLDDIVEYGWNSLSRVQQIGVKYYDEFLSKIPRAEVESIAAIILAHANKIRKGFQSAIVGGYRRGKAESGDVDVILSNPDPDATHEFINALVESLEKYKFITHLLAISTRNSERGQAPLSWNGDERKAGVGFDTLDKALVVWQDPVWDKTSQLKNTNPHRRVDIIITPWKTAGCAVIGWTGATTFERDLRRYCKHEKSLKFDSSGIRSQTDGHWVDFESGPDGKPSPDMLTAEKRVFQGLGLEWRPPEERCTG